MSGRESTTRDERQTLARDALVIVLTGVLLGVAFNAVQRSSRPSRGLPWIAAKQSLASVDTLVLSGAAPAPGHAPAEAVTMAAPSTRSATPAVAATPAAVAPAGPASTTDPGGAVVSAPPASKPHAGLPIIPDTGEPLEVGLSTVAKLVEAEAALVVDARERDAFVDGHIPGAVNVPYDEAIRDPAPLGKLDHRGRPIIVYCSGGTCEASLLLAQMMVREFHLRRVLVYEGGFPEWVAAGHPVSRESR